MTPSNFLKKSLNSLFIDPGVRSYGNIVNLFDDVTKIGLWHVRFSSIFGCTGVSRRSGRLKWIMSTNFPQKRSRGFRAITRKHEKTVQKAMTVSRWRHQCIQCLSYTPQYPSVVCSFPGSYRLDVRNTAAQSWSTSTIHETELPTPWTDWNTAGELPFLAFALTLCLFIFFWEIPQTYKHTPPPARGRMFTRLWNLPEN